MDTDWGMVADDRINTELDFSNINSKQDYLRELNNYLGKTATGRTLIKKGVQEEMYENSRAKKKIETKELEEERESYNKAKKFQKRRGRRGVIDQRRTVKRTLKANKRNVKKWMKRPNKSDIKGIDTKILSKKNKITKKEIMIFKKYNIQASINKRGIKQYRNKKGQFVKKSKINSLKV